MLANINIRSACQKVSCFNPNTSGIVIFHNHLKIKTRISSITMPTENQK